MNLGNFNALKEVRPDLAEMYLGYYQKLSKEDFLNMTCGDILDLHSMQERVSMFMQLCTINMSKTTYTPDSIRMLVETKQQYDLIDFCKDLMDDYATPEEMYEYIKQLSEQVL